MSLNFYKRINFVQSFLLYNISQFGNSGFSLSRAMSQKELQNWEKKTH